MDESNVSLIYREIRSKILDETYPVGHKLTENILASEYGCSRTPIREAFKRLESDGFVQTKPKSGTYVRRDTKKELIELIQVRAYLESLAFHLCLKTITDRELLKLEKMKEEMDLLVQDIPINMLRFARVHYDFHHTIVKASRNVLLIRFFERLNLRSSYLFFDHMNQQEGHKTEEEHDLILTYLRNKDPKGIDYMKNHLFRKFNLT